MDQKDYIQAAGALPSPLDPNSWTLASVGAPEVYPDSCFLDTDWMVASNQSKIGCCVGCTGEETVRQIVYLSTGVMCNPGTANELSWRFVYALAKCLEGTIQTNPDGTTSDYTMYGRTATADDGTYPALVAKIIRKYGVPLAKLCPNNTNLTADDFCYRRDIKSIPAGAFTDALTRRSGADMNVPVTIDGIKKALTYAKANKGAVMILRRIGDTYWKGQDGINTWDAKKLLPMRVPTVIVSGHEELLTGFDMEPNTGRMRLYWLNHWSTLWCTKGRAWEYADEWLPLIGELRVVVTSVPTNDSFTYTFTKALAQGQMGPDVVALQHVLKLEGCFPEKQAFTGNYGPLTKAGVKALQEKYTDDILKPVGLSTGTGKVGPSTLAWLIKNYSN
jgi:hypothetical protein